MVIKVNQNSIGVLFGKISTNKMYFIDIYKYYYYYFLNKFAVSFSTV